jgi:RNA polymerase-binding transcription factor DksA
MMKATDLKVFRKTLEALRSRLRGDVSTMAEAALRHTGSDASGDLSRMPIHMADIGTDAYEQEFTLSLMAKKRLEAIPFAAMCIRCAEKMENGGFGRPRQPR